MCDWWSTVCCYYTMFWSWMKSLYLNVVVYLFIFSLLLSVYPGNNKKTKLEYIDLWKEHLLSLEIDRQEKPSIKLENDYCSKSRNAFMFYFVSFFSRSPSQQPLNTNSMQFTHLFLTFFFLLSHVMEMNRRQLKDWGNFKLMADHSTVSKKRFIE